MADGDVIMDVQFSGAVDFAPLLTGIGGTAGTSARMNTPAVGAGDEHANMLQAQQSVLNPLSGGVAAMVMSTELALNAGMGANINIWA